MAHTLIIKGDKIEVLKTLEDRGIKALEVTKHPEFNECIVRTAPDAPWQELAAWFLEDKGNAPFPPGTLLWYGPYSPYTA